MIFKCGKIDRRIPEVFLVCLMRREYSGCMKLTVARKCLVLLLTLTLALGQGAFMPNMAMASTVKSERDAPQVMDMGATDQQMDCCPSCDKDHPMKGSTCAAMCASMTQAALPSTFTAFVRFATRVTYSLTNSVAMGRQLLPDSPPPKA